MVSRIVDEAEKLMTGRRADVIESPEEEKVPAYGNLLSSDQ
jgi:hypothetical protein